MNKSELVAAVAEKSALNNKQADANVTMPVHIPETRQKCHQTNMIKIRVEIGMTVKS